MSKSHKVFESHDAVYGDRMLTEVMRLHSALQAAPLPLDLDGVDDLRTRRVEILEQLGDYVIPRLMAREAPLLAVVGGSTGAGKSTLVNTLVGSPVTEAGVLRPTTRSPVLVHHPADAEWFAADHLLPELKRVNDIAHDQGKIQLVAIDTVPQGLAILDAPDVDSVEEQNRHLAGQLLAAADLWLFVTSAARYSDQIPWEYLKQAAERSTAVAVVLDRTPPDAVDYVSTHLARMLAARGLKDSPLFRVAEGVTDEQGLLPPGHVAEIRHWIEALADDAQARLAIVDQTLSGAVRTLTRKLHAVADASDEQWAAGQALASLTRQQYDAVLGELSTATRDGTLVRGDLFARWQAFLGSGELIRGLQTRSGPVRDRLRSALKGQPEAAEALESAVHAAVTAAIEEHAERAAVRAVDARRATGYGAPGDRTDVAGASADLRARAAAEVRIWLTELQQMVRDASGDLAASAQFLAFGVRGLTGALAVVALARDGVSEEARESVELGRRLLDTVFGPTEIASMLDAARDALARRATTLLTAEGDRYAAVAGDWGLREDASVQLREAVRRVDDLRFAAKDPLGGIR